MNRLVIAASCFVALLTLSHARLAQASTWSNSSVSYVSCIAGVSYCSVTLASTAPKQATCATGGPSMTVPLANNDNGKDMFKLLLAAKAAGWQVSLIGTGACTTLGTQEDIAMVQVH
jgi:hypothetical protein